MKSIRWIYMYTKRSRVMLLMLVSVVLVSALCNLMIASILKMFIDVAMGVTSTSLMDVVMLAGLVLGIGGVMYILSSLLKSKIECNMERKLRHEIMHAAFQANYQDIQKVHTADILTKLTTDAISVAQFFPCIVIDVVGSLLVALGAVVYLFVLNTKLTMFIFVIIPILIAIISLFNYPIAKADKNKKDAEESNRILMQEELTNLKCVKVYKLENKVLRIFDKNYRRFEKRKLIFGMWEGTAQFLNGLLSNAMLLISLGVGAFFVMKGITTVGALVAVVQLLNYIVYPFEKMSEAISKLAQAGASVDRINEILCIKKDEPILEKSENEFEAIKMSNVSFGYEKDCVLDKLSYTFLKNNVYCIVGENGSGKTTILNMLAGLLKPSEGKIVLIDKEGNIVKDDIRNDIALVSAEENLFSSTIKDNLCLFEENVCTEKMNRALDMMNLGDFVNQLPDKEYTRIAERGNSLSSGQIQRIALSRALYYNSPIILLDEPSTNLDAESVKLLLRLIEEEKKNRVIIIASHDEQIIDACDYVMEV